MFIKSIARMASVMSLLLISACGGGGGGGGGGSDGGVTTNVVSSAFSGSVGDGPVVGATVRIHDRNGSLLQTEVSDGYANYSTRLDAEENAFPLILEVDDGTDLVTGRAPDFKLTSVVMHPLVTQVNINPHTTLMLAIARKMSGGISAANISAARAIVMEQLNFGLAPAFVDDPLGSQITDENVAAMVKASEVLGEMIRRTRDHLLAIGVVASGDEVVAAIADDLFDGELDGRGGSLASSRMAAVSKLVSAQVLIEALSNNLEVGGTPATARMDDAIVATRPSVPLSALTGSVPVNQELLVQARDNITVAQVLLPSGELDAIAAVLESLRAGVLASDVEAVLPAGTSDALNPSIAVAVEASDAQLDAALGGGDETPPPVENTAPVLSGAPATSVLEDTAYLYQPTASDAEGDALSFSIQNRPGWASFNTSTGRLSGTPLNQHVGTYSNIVLTVSDGSLTDAVGPFSITVVNTNDAPAISGSPPASATAGGFYSFQPSASDPDGDDLTFSITNRPAWADFNTATGRLSGTPADGDADIYDGIVISVSDGSVSRSLPAFSIAVTANAPSNRAPVISGTPASSVAEDSVYSFTPGASDPDGDNLSFSISNRPSWASFNPGTGQLSGIPENADVGTTNNILITVSDGAATDSIGPFSITVSNTNDAPVISGVPAASVAEDSLYNFQPGASDPDNDSLTYSISNKPAWASFSTATGNLTGTPGNGDVGTTNNILITVSDGAASDAIGPFSITVSNTNDAPVISGVPAASVAEDSLYNFQPGASDPDNDSLTYSISNKPAWASFSTTTGNLSGTPGNGDVGTTNNILITVSDGAASDAIGPFSITVSNTNDAPVISGAPAAAVTANESYSFQPGASDVDGDPLTFSISNKPAWAGFDTSSGRLSGTPDDGDVLTYSNIVISVTDGIATASLPAFSITVDPAPAPTPTLGSFSLSWTAPVARADGEPLSLADISGYGIYFGNTPGNYTDVIEVNDGTATSATVTDIPLGTVYVVMKTYDVDGRESGYSLEVSRIVQ